MIIAAPNGARRTKADHPNLPITVEEIAAEAANCYGAGASVMHLHVRDKNGAHSLDAGLYRAASEAIAVAAPEMVVQITTEAAGVFGLEAQIACVEDVMPEAVSVAWREFNPEENQSAERFYSWAAEAGIHVQHILYSVAEIERFKAHGMQDQSVLLVLGKYQGQEASLVELPQYVAALGEVHDWSLCSFGKQEHALAQAAIAMGGHVRVGFENNLWLADGSLAPNTAALVKQFKLDAMSAKEIRQFWRIKSNG